MTDRQATMKLRLATPADMPGIMQLEETGFLPGIREEEAVFRDRLTTFPAGFLVGEDADGGLLAYLSSELWPGGDSLDDYDFSIGHSARERHRDDGQVLYISSMTISPQARGSGLGRQLFEEGVAAIDRACPTVREHLLIVNETWIHAKRIYDSAGFREVRRMPGFFDPLGLPAQAAIVMTRARPAQP